MRCESGDVAKEGSLGAVLLSSHPPARPLTHDTSSCAAAGDPLPRLAALAYSRMSGFTPSSSNVCLMITAVASHSCSLLPSSGVPSTWHAP